MRVVIGSKSLSRVYFAAPFVIVTIITLFVEAFRFHIDINAPGTDSLTCTINSASAEGVLKYYCTPTLIVQYSLYLYSMYVCIRTTIRMVKSGENFFSTINKLWTSFRVLLLLGAYQLFSFFPLLATAYHYFLNVDNRDKLVNSTFGWIECHVVGFMEEDAIEQMTGIPKTFAYVDKCGIVPDTRIPLPLTEFLATTCLLGIFFIFLASFNSGAVAVWSHMISYALATLGGSKNATVAPKIIERRSTSVAFSIRDFENGKIHAGDNDDNDRGTTPPSSTVKSIELYNAPNQSLKAKEENELASPIVNEQTQHPKNDATKDGASYREVAIREEV